MRPALMAASRGAAAAVILFDPNPGFHQSSGGTSAYFTISATIPVVWAWSSEGNVPTSTVTNGGTAAQITFSLSTVNAPKLSTITVEAEGQVWTVELSVGGGGSN